MAKRASKNQPMLAGFEDLFPSESVASESQVTKPSPRRTEAIATSSKPSLSSVQPKAPYPVEGDLVVLVDSHSLIYQVFHAMPAMTSPQGVEVGAAHGFLRDIANLLQQWDPDFLICTFDASGTTFRNEIYDQYKAHREPMPDALRHQLPLIHECLDVLSIPKVSLPGYEADDIIATLADQAQQRGARVLLVTSDKDCRQLLSDHIQMLNVRKNDIFDVGQLKSVWGIRPDQVVDFQAMVGDSVDNVPGVPMIGPKAAQQLLDEFDSLDEILANIDKIKGEKKQENFRIHRDKAIMSRDLVQLKRDCPIELPWSQMRPGSYDRNQVQEMFRDLGFRKLSETFFAIQKDFVPTAPVQLSKSGYRTIRDEGELSQLISELNEAKVIAIDTETTSTRARDARLVGVSMSWSEGQAAYIPVLAPHGEPHLPLSTVCAQLAPVLADPIKCFVGQNVKYDSLVLRSHGMPIARVSFDTMVADYLLEAGGRNHDLDDIAKRWLSHENISIDSLIGTGKDQITMDLVPVEQVSVYACEDVDVPYRIVDPMMARLREEELVDVLETLELPLISTLARMEYEGIRIDVQRLRDLGAEFRAKACVLCDEIIAIAGESFNLDSPKQLATILFERLGLRVVKKTKTGPSTDAEVLEELAAEHPLPAKLLEYRQLTKLINTYVDTLPKLISPATGRIHTSFRQDIAATGRLSSVEPNLQNIPVRTEEGRSIRSAFMAREPEWVLMTADYSQIELRVLAHYCGDAALAKAFVENVDIHTSVAAEVNGVATADVTSAMRRDAKAVSFGILYGQSPFGLAKALGISRTEAGSFIDAYFDKYPGVRDFIAHTLRECRRSGYVKTMSGRKRFLRGIRDYETLPDAKKKQLLEPERMAINTVIQGSAADMIKLAMIAIDRELQTLDWPVRMLLQIHDELVFETHPDCVQKLAELVRRVMTTVMPLSVPLKVDVKQGKNWAECEPL
jgi:DNA polymerase I